MRSTIIVERKGEVYRGTVQGRYGGGYSNAVYGKTPDEAAGKAAAEMVRYGQSNPEGGSLVAPPEVMALVPEHLREVDGKKVSRSGWIQVRVSPDESERIAAEATTAGKTVSEYVRDRALRKK